MGLLYCEEPLPVELVHQRAALQSAHALPIIGDDSCFTLRDLRRELALDTFDILNIKTPRTGYTESSEMLELARSAGKGRDDRLQRRHRHRRGPGCDLCGQAGRRPPVRDLLLSQTARKTYWSSRCPSSTATCACPTPKPHASTRIGCVRQQEPRGPGDTGGVHAQCGSQLAASIKLTEAVI